MDITVSADIDPEFLTLVREILEDSEFRKLGLYTQHLKTTRLMHSINVSYLSWLAARRFGWDERTAARAGLLHDFFLYSCGDETPSKKLMAFDHPRTAARNSEERFGISDKERRAILSHMFPLGPVPTSREAWLISCTDKFCACVEFLHVEVALARNNRVVINAA